MAYRNYGPAEGLTVNTTAGCGDFTTVTAAMAVAVSGQTVYLNSSVTENFTITPGVNLTAMSSSGDTPTVSIVGKITMSGAGTSTISNIRLTTNSDFAIVVSGTADSNLYLFGCFINALNNTAISYTSSGSLSRLRLNYCFGDIGTTGISYFTIASGGSTFLFNSFLGNGGNSSTNSTISSGLLQIQGCLIGFAITTSGTGGILATNNKISTSSQAVTALTLGGSGVHGISHCDISSGSASTISITNAVTSLATLNISSSNTNPITGAGTVTLSDITYSASGVTPNVSVMTGWTTQIGTLSLINPLTVANGGTGAITLTGVLIGNGTSAVTATNYPQVTGLGIGASPGSTAGLTFDGTNFMNNYVVGTYTPTMEGSATAGTTTYTVQNGYYVRIGALVQIQARVAGTGATGTGTVTFRNIPFTIKNQSIGSTAIGAVECDAAQTFGVGTTYLVTQPQSNTTNILVNCCGSAVAAAALAIANVTFDYRYSNTYQI